MNPVFTETQKFNKWWHYLLAGFPVFLTLVIYLGLLLDFMPVKADQKKGEAMIILIVTIFFLVLFFLWFIFLKLNTTIDKDGIVAKFTGIPFCKRTIRWEEIQSVSVVTYSPLYDYGGWGVRYSLSGNGWCYNVSGNKGIRIIYTNGKSFLIGTQQAEEAEKVINFYYKT